MEYFRLEEENLSRKYNGALQNQTKIAHFSHNPQGQRKLKISFLVATSKVLF